MKIIDNLIDDKSLKNITDVLLGVEFPWYYNSSKSSIDDCDNFQFTHIFFTEKTIKTTHWKLVLPILEKLEIKDLIRVKANLTPRKDINYKYPMHTDTDLKSHKTSVFYVNTNNGGTIFQNGKKANSKANRLVEFDSHQMHAGVDCTDNKVRVVINFNYTKK